MTEPNRQETHNIEDLDPRQLRQDLKELFRTAPLSSTPVDDAVIAAAQRHFAGHRRSRLLLRTAAISAAAASITLVVWLTTPDGSPRATIPTLQHPSVAYHEIAQSKRVDIRDAFLLAKRLDAAEPLKPQWDFNGDGHVDRADVDAIAMAAVKLDGGAVQ